MVKEQYLINEAAKEVHVESHVLRYWEEELDLPIGRNEQGHRVYTKGDIDKFIKIKNLKDQGLQLKAVRTIMEPERIQQEHSNNRVQYLFQKLIKEAVSSNNDEMVGEITKRITDSIRQDIAKEIDYQFRMQDERNDARIDERTEEHYRQLDSLLRKYNEKPSNDNTLIFPNKKEKKERHLFKKLKKNATP